MNIYLQNISPRRSFLSRWFFPLIVILAVLIDQASKSIISFYLNDFQSIPVIPDFFHLTLVHNTGIAFGMFHGGSWILMTIIFAGILFLFYLSYLMRREPVLFRAGLAMILGGAVGNLIDRIRLGAVTDFLDFRIWPVFNLADSFITIGVALLILTVLFRKKT